MGDRALVVFKETSELVGKTEYSPVIYLHWNGEDVPGLLQKTKKVMEGREHDLSYTSARFIGVCNNYLEGNLSLGMWNLPSNFNQWTKKEKIKYGHGDAGLIVVDINTWLFEQYGGGYKLKQIAHTNIMDINFNKNKGIAKRIHASVMGKLKGATE